MPVVIGAKPGGSFADPIGLLKDCHRRIERFLSVLAQVSGRSSLDAGQRTSLETALRYFREAAPKHTADEEETLFPKLRQIERNEVKAVLAMLDSLEDDHVRANTIHTEVDRIGQNWLESGSLSPAEAVRFSELVENLVELYRAHITVEERDLFPAAAAVLGKPECEAMGAEMAARRDLRQQGFPPVSAEPA